MVKFYINPWRDSFYFSILLLLIGLYTFFIEKNIIDGISVLSAYASIHISLLYARTEKHKHFKKLTFIILIATLILTAIIIFFSVFARNEIEAIENMGLGVLALLYIARTARLEK